MTDTIRSVRRALTLIRLMNKRDSWTLKQIAEESGLAKATTFRLLHTLYDEGYVHLSPKLPGVYRLSSKVRELAAGLTRFTLFADQSEPIVISTTRQTGWPVSFAMPSAPFMRIVACGMPFRPDHSAKPTSVGREHWMFSSAVGSAYLSRCTRDQVAACLDAAMAEHRSDDTTPLPTIQELCSKLDSVRTAGYALRIANSSEINSTMAVPVFRDDGIIGAIACSTFPHSLSHQLIRRLEPALLEAANNIAVACGDVVAAEPVHPSRFARSGESPFPPTLDTI